MNGFVHRKFLPIVLPIETIGSKKVGRARVSAMLIRHQVKIEKK